MIVTDTFYSITAPVELQLRLSDLCAISYYAKALGLNDLSKQAKDAYFELSKQWDEQAEKDAKKKSSGWFKQVIGGGSYYSVSSSNHWENDSLLWEAMSKAATNAEIQKELKKLLDKVNQ